MSYQLCFRDEYGSTSILQNSTDPFELVKAAKTKVTKDNFDNALTLAEQQVEWESCVVEFYEKDEQISNAIYAGKTVTGKESGYLIKKGSPEEFLLSDVDIELRFYIGERLLNKATGEKAQMYAQKAIAGQRNVKKLINSFSDQILEGKAFYYIKSI